MFQLLKKKDNNELNLRSWIYSQRKKYKNGTLEEDKIKLLNQIKMVWEVDDYKKDKKTGITNYWFKMYEYSKQYYQSHGDLLIPKRYKINVLPFLKVTLYDVGMSKRLLII